jgi:hypothetical protein
MKHVPRPCPTSFLIVVCAVGPQNLNKKSVADVDVSGKRVLMRVDFNVPQDKTGAITNTQVRFPGKYGIRAREDHGRDAMPPADALARPTAFFSRSGERRACAEARAQLPGSAVARACLSFG